MKVRVWQHSLPAEHEIRLLQAAFEDFNPLKGFPYDDEEEALSQCLMKIQHSISKAIQDAQRELKFMKAQSEKKFMLSRIEDKKAQRKVARLHKRLARQAAAVKYDNAMRQNRERQIAGHKASDHAHHMPDG